MTPTSLFRPGENCAEVARADRIGFVVDSEYYFRLFMLACEHAQREILILGWDFDSRTVLWHEPDKPPVRLGEFLNGLVRRKRHLRIYILDWDFPMVYGTDRERLLTLAGSWRPHRRIDFRYDDTHPIAGSHHQKVVVIDDKLAFSGGLDLTNRRWDTSQHKADDPRRSFEGAAYAPVHDVMVAVDGAAARALGHVARERWFLATGETLKPVPVARDPWPDGLAVDLTNVDIAVACTAPPTAARDGVYQIEALYLDMIARARRYIYIENQYFTSRKIGEALARRLADPAGPEVILVTRLLSHGWLEEITMTTLRDKLVGDLRGADVHNRFHAFYADLCGLPEGMCLDVHSKVMIVDDEWARVGSSNLSDRSMGLDTECDVVVEARGDERAATAIRRFCHSLIAEHVCADVETITQRVESRGSLAAAIDGMGTPERCLKKLDPAPPPKAKLAVAGLGDPDHPIFETMATGEPLASRPNGFLLRRAMYVVGGLVAVAVSLSLIWTQTPLSMYVTRENAVRLASTLAQYWWVPLAVIAAYTPASFIMFPRWVITTTAVIAFGAWSGFVYAMAGVLLAGVVTFIPGRIVTRDTMRRIAGPQLKPLTKFMQGRGVIGVALVRLVPIAPFPVVNGVLGAMRVKLRHFVVGTFLGMLPGMAATTVLSDQVAGMLDGSKPANFWMIGGAVVTIGALAFFGQRYIRRKATN